LGGAICLATSTILGVGGRREDISMFPSLEYSSPVAVVSSELLVFATDYGIYQLCVETLVGCGGLTRSLSLRLVQRG
jgi:hypothetical protein